MALADTANLMVKLSLGGNFLSQIGKATTGLSKFDTKLGQVESRAFRAGQQIGTGIRNAGRLAAVGIGFLVSQVGFGLQSLIELEQQQAQTNAVIKSTGGIAGITADEVGRLSEKYESLNAIISDEVIRSGENLLLTFTNIRKEAFEPALAAVLDMNTALGKGPEGLTSTALLVGKALQDPEKGLSRLGRAVGGFSDETIKAVKEAVKQNDTLKAQTIILAELDKRYRGSFIAQGDTTAGKVALFGDAIEDLQRTLAVGLLPVVGNVADALQKTLADPSVIAGVRAFGESLAGLISPANLAEAGRILGDVFAAARAAAPTIAASAEIMGRVVGTAVSLFRSLPPDIQKLAVAGFAVNKLTGGLVTNLAGGLIGSVVSKLFSALKSAVVNVRGAVVNVTGGVGGAATGAAGAAAAGGRGRVAGTLGTIAQVILPIAAAEIIGGAIVDASGGPVAGTKDAGTGRVIAELAGIKLAIGGNQAVLVRAASAAERTREQQAAFAIRDREQAPPIVNVDVDVNVSARGVVTQNVRNSRSGPQGGSRELSRRNSIG